MSETTPSPLGDFIPPPAHTHAPAASHAHPTGSPSEPSLCGSTCLCSSSATGPGHSDGVDNLSTTPQPGPSGPPLSPDATIQQLDEVLRSANEAVAKVVASLVDAAISINKANLSTIARASTQLQLLEELAIGLNQTTNSERKD